MSDIQAYTDQVKARHRDAFDLWLAAASLYRTAQETARPRPTDLHIVLDMLLLQASNAHTALGLLAQHGLQEDGATLARRLMEISIQTTYIAADEDARVRAQRAGKYLAYLWRRLPRRVKHRLPPSLRAEWSRTCRRFGRLVPEKAKRWGPNMRTMFRECHAEDLYLTDYSFLSEIAHGSPEEQILRFSASQIRAHDHQHVSPLLVYGSKYLAIVGEHWNGVFGILPASDVDALRDKLAAWRRPGRHRRVNGREDS